MVAQNLYNSKKMVKISICIFLLIGINFSSVFSQEKDTIIEFGYPFEYAPVFKGDLRYYIQESLIYPESAVKDSIGGKIYITFEVDTLGFTANYKIEKGIREDLNKEALRVIKSLHFEEPAFYNKKPVKFIMTLPIEFYLSDTIKSSKKIDCKEQ
jgi:TonB family protein